MKYGCGAESADDDDDIDGGDKAGTEVTAWVNNAVERR